MGVFPVSYRFIIACLLASVSLSAQQKATVLSYRETGDHLFTFFESNTGAIVYEGRDQEALLLNHSLGQVRIGDHWYLVTLQQGLRNERGYEQVRKESFGRIAFRREGKWGFFDGEGREVIAPKYSIVFDFKEQGTVVNEGGDWFVIDSYGTRTSSRTHPDLVYIKGRMQEGPMIEISERGLNTPEGKPMESEQGSVLPNGPVTSGGGCPPNIGFENGNFDAWSAYVGVTKCVSGVNRNEFDLSAPAYSRHTLISNNGGTLLDPYGFFNVNPPDGSKYFVLLGNDINGAKAERLRYVVQVPANVPNYSIRYNYAVVFEDPSHTRCEQPRFSAKLFDPATNTYLPCGTFEHVADESIPGFYDSPLSPMIKVKPWSEAFINLTAYAGKTLYLEFSNSDCTRGGHWGYSYLDVNKNCDLTADIEYQCIAPHKTTLTGPSGFKEYKWWDQQFSASIGNAQKLVLNPGLSIGSKLWVEVLPYSGLGCRDTLPVTITPLYPSASFQTPLPQCFSGNNLAFTSTSTSPKSPVTEHLWDMGDLSSQAGRTISHKYASSGSFDVTLIAVDGNGCRDTVSGQVKINPDPVAAVISNKATTFCAGDNIQLISTASSPGGMITRYQWMNNGIMLDGEDKATLDVYQSGTFQLRVTDENQCMDTSAVVAVYANPLPEGELQPPAESVICAGSRTIMRVNGNAAGYQWFRNGVLLPNETSAQLELQEGGVYTVQMTSTKGCKTMANGAAEIKLRTAPKPDFSYAVYCRGIPIPFKNISDTAASGSVSWTWDFGDGQISEQEHPTHIYDRGTAYTVKLKATPLRCPSLTSTVSKVVDVEDPLPGIRYASVNAVANSNSTVKARNFGKEYLWFPSTGLRDPRRQQTSFYHDQPLEYTIRIKTAAGCVTNDTLLVRMFKQADILVPNAFSPNGDGHNDRLDIFPVGLREFRYFRVFNRWGQLLYQTRLAEQKWDGTFRGVQQPLETYVWIAEGVSDRGEMIIRRGQTILIR